MEALSQRHQLSSTTSIAQGSAAASSTLLTSQKQKPKGVMSSSNFIQTAQLDLTMSCVSP